MNHLVKAVYASILVSTFCLGQKVTISQPADGSQKTSPVSIQATTSGFTQGVQVIQLYVDGNKAYEQSGGTLSTSKALSVGDHRIAVQAIGNSGKIAKSIVNITIKSAPTPTPTPVPTPSATPTPKPAATPSTVYSNTQEASDWRTCGACGNIGGSGTTAPYLMTRGTTNPVLDGASTSAEFWIGGSTPYINAYWYLPHYPAPSTPVKQLIYDFYMYIPSAYEKAPQAIEFECQQTVNGYTYNFAWQADYGRDIWRTFDYNSKHWVSTSIAFKGFTPNTWHHIIAEYHVEGTSSVHDALTVDGVRHEVRIVRPGKKTSQTWNSFTNAFQLDLNSKPTPYKVYVDRMNVKLR